MHGQYTESVESNLFRTQMEGGIAKTAPKSGKQQVNHGVVYLMSTSELASFRTWFHDTALDGSKFFNWVHPITGDTIDARISDGTYSVNPVNARANYFYVTLNLESYR